MNYFNNMSSGYGFDGGFGASIFSTVILIMVWSLFWKGIALWNASKRSEPWWFIALLVINTLGILEIIYIFAIAKIKLSELFDNIFKQVSENQR
jgi:hypothetical protein